MIADKELFQNDKNVQQEQDFKVTTSVNTPQGLRIEGIASPIGIIENKRPLVADFLRKSFDEAVDFRRTSGVDKELLEDLAQVKGEYTQEQKIKIMENEEPLVYDPYTEVKCAAANAWLSDVLSNTATEKPWKLVATQIPTLPAFVVQDVTEEAISTVAAAQLQGILPQDLHRHPELLEGVIKILEQHRDEILNYIQLALKKEAEARAERMDRLIYDQMQDGGFDSAFNNFLEYFTKFKTAILKGPVITNEKDISFVGILFENGRIIVPAIVPRLKYRFYAPNPLDIYPSPDTIDANTGVIHERARIRRKDLEALFGVEGVNEEELKLALSNPPKVSYQLSQFDQERSYLEGRGTALERSTDLIECVFYSGPIKGEYLMEWFGSYGTGSPFLPYLEYYVDALLVGDRVVKIAINPDPLGATNYYSASYRRVPGSFWGKSIPSLMRDKQKVLNACLRALTTNMAFIAGPMAWADPSGLMPGETLESIHPRQIFQLRKRPDGSTTKPFEFFSPVSHVGELIAISDKIKEQIHDDVGIPPYQYGSLTMGGAGRTASGLAMLLTASSRGIKKAIANIDECVIKPLIRRMWVMNMLYYPDDSVKGDMDVVPSGVMSLFVRENITMKRINILQSTLNPTDMLIFGLQGRTKLWREVFKGLQLDPDGIVPTEEELMSRLSALQQPVQLQSKSKAASEQKSEEEKEVPIESEEDVRTPIQPEE